MYARNILVYIVTLVHVYMEALEIFLHLDALLAAKRTRLSRRSNSRLTTKNSAGRNTVSANLIVDRRVTYELASLKHLNYGTERYSVKLWGSVR